MSLLSLNCWVVGDSPDEMFTVEIHKTDNVSILKEIIKEKNANSFYDFDFRQLDLWRSASLDDLTPNDLRTLVLGPALKPLTVLKDLFSSPLDPQKLHIIARPPQIGTCHLGSTRIHSRSPSMLAHASLPAPSSLKPIIQRNDVEKRREAFCSARKPQAPSAGGVPLTFNTDTHIYCDRPFKMIGTIPVALLHPAFGQFQDDCEKSIPAAEDFELLDSIVDVMTRVYDLEEDRQTEIMMAFYREHLPIIGSHIGQYCTDGDLKVDDFRYLLAELKNEIGSTNTEPYFQAIHYYLESTRKQAVEYSDSVLPCFVILMFGALPSSVRSPFYFHCIYHRSLHCICGGCMDRPS
jgi:hypothetical protein